METEDFCLLKKRPSRLMTHEPRLLETGAAVAGSVCGTGLVAGFRRQVRLDHFRIGGSSSDS